MILRAVTSCAFAPALAAGTGSGAFQVIECTCLPCKIKVMNELLLSWSLYCRCVCVG